LEHLRQPRCGCRKTAIRRRSAAPASGVHRWPPTLHHPFLIIYLLNYIINYWIWKIGFLSYWALIWKPIIKKKLVYNCFFFVELVWFFYKMDLIIKIEFSLDSGVVKVILIFCTSLVSSNWFGSSDVGTYRKNETTRYLLKKSQQILFPKVKILSCLISLICLRIRNV
jgi:hypothetical protein